MPQQHNSKEVARLFKQLERKGFAISAKSKKGTVKITPPEGVTGAIYHTHATQSCLHQIRRDFAKMYGVEL